MTTDQRQAFEAWAISLLPLGRSDGEYTVGQAAHAWRTWQAATAAEREACADIADNICSEYGGNDPTTQMVAAAIRARGEE